MRLPLATAHAGSVASANKGVVRVARSSADTRAKAMASHSPSAQTGGQHDQANH
jgi:hypothetical protein